ncbi:response regulator [Actinoplanes sp. NPDC026670]|uniref:response regulator n=1 Tax=Actinoplanes sp. NPDC026670 TaxID=3154700 RepID=UPI0033FB48A5
MKRDLVLVAEDDRDIRDLLHFALEDAGYQTVGARDGAAAARILGSAHPVGLITDVRMPDMNGIDLCRLVRRTPAIGNTAILMYSAGTHRYDVEAGLHAGADRYLAKPFSPRRLVTELHEVINSRR